MSKFNFGDPVRVISAEDSDLEIISRTGKIIEVGINGEGADIYITDIPNNMHFGGLHRATEDELELMPEPDTHEYTLDDFSTVELAEELLRRLKL